MSQSQEKNVRQQVAQAVKAVESKKGEDVAILELNPTTDFTNYFLLCSGTNPRQIQAISDEVERQLAQVGVRARSVEGYKQAEWVLLDYVDFVVHIFSEDKRTLYDLERLWRSAPRLSPADLAVKKPAAKKTAAVSSRSGMKRKAAAGRSKARTKTKKRTRKS
jgi:ribosome-associated protein